jgi:hypothetical protein
MPTFKNYLLDKFQFNRQRVRKERLLKVYTTTFFLQHPMALHALPSYKSHYFERSKHIQREKRKNAINSGHPIN